MEPTLLAAAEMARRQVQTKVGSDTRYLVRPHHGTYSVCMGQREELQATQGDLQSDALHLLKSPLPSVSGNGRKGTEELGGGVCLVRGATSRAQVDGGLRAITVGECEALHVFSAQRNVRSRRQGTRTGNTPQHCRQCDLLLLLAVLPL